MKKILHCDMNNFYASVECMLNPELKQHPIAVCGSVEERHGIVLAKNYKAKAYGVQTGDAVWQARQKCKDIVIVPPHYDEYLKYSRLAHDIYDRYTDLVEPFGMDECWLDITGSTFLFGDARKIAEEIRAATKRELGLTISIGVSFNKVFAKLGSDMKKPDAITEIPFESYKEKIWDLPASDMIGVGRATKKKLESRCIYTIGDLAKYDPKSLKYMLGINGVKLWRFANGMDNSSVSPSEYTAPIKSIGHGITCVEDLTNNHDVFKVILEMTQNISKKLKENALLARGVCLTVRDNKLYSKSYRGKLDYASHSAKELTEAAYELFVKNYRWYCDIRSITVTAINLIPDNMPEQLDFFCNTDRREKTEQIENTISEIRRRFGQGSVTYACLLGETKMPIHKSIDITMPTGVFS